MFGRGVRDVQICHKTVNNSSEGVLQSRRREEVTTVAYRVFWSVDGMRRIWPHNPTKKNGEELSLEFENQIPINLSQTCSRFEDYGFNTPQT
jgi:hypothetical protein